MGESILDIINRYYSVYKNSQEGGPGSRYRSWEWCHKSFLDKRKSVQDGNCLTEEDYDYLSLQLAFYLASWGMYRGSSFLLDRDYKAHKNAVKKIMDDKYDCLWDYQPNKNNLEETKKLLFDSPDGIYWEIKDSYGNSNVATDTLTTKILLGTFACIPAFDTYLKKGIDWYNKNNQGNLKTSIESSSGRKATDGFNALLDFAVENSTQINELVKEYNYPAMKILDMYFWEIGYEL